MTRVLDRADQVAEAEPRRARGRIAKRRGWLDVAELGSLRGLRFVSFVCTTFGRDVARALLAAVTLYFMLVRRNVRRSSREYLRRIGLPARLPDVYAHVRCFADTLVDRLFLLRRELHRYRVTQIGHQHMVALTAQRRGAILLGAHLGSFEAMRMRSDAYRMPLNVVGYFRNAARLNQVLRRINPELDTRFIGVEPESPAFILEVKERIEAGELVAILGDRVGHGSRTRARFLGGTIELPTGPYVIAAVLGCPVYLTFGLYFAPNHYELHCEPFAETITLTREDRQAQLGAYAQRYADRLEYYCRKSPRSWFNFYDYWLPANGETGR